MMLAFFAGERGSKWRYPENISSGLSGLQILLLTVIIVIIHDGYI